MDRMQVIPQRLTGRPVRKSARMTAKGSKALVVCASSGKEVSLRRRVRALLKVGQSAIIRMTCCFKCGNTHPAILNAAIVRAVPPCSAKGACNVLKKPWTFSRDHWSAGTKLHTTVMMAMLETVKVGGTGCNFEYGPNGVEAKIRDNASATALSTPGICSSVNSNTYRYVNHRCTLALMLCCILNRFRWSVHVYAR